METKSWFGVRIPFGARILFFSKTCRPSLDPKLPPIQWVLRVPEVKAAGSWGWPVISILFLGYRWVDLYLRLLYMPSRHVQRHFHLRMSTKNFLSGFSCHHVQIGFCCRCWPMWCCWQVQMLQEYSHITPASWRRDRRSWKRGSVWRLVSPPNGRTSNRWKLVLRWNSSEGMLAMLIPLGLLLLSFSVGLW